MTDDDPKPSNSHPETVVRLRALRSFGMQPYLKIEHPSVPDPNSPLLYHKGDILEVPFSQAIRLIASGNAVRVTEDSAEDKPTS